MRIKKFNQYNEEVSGTELVGPIGPGYGETRTQNKTINSHDTNVFFSQVDNKIYTEDDWNNIYQEYLKNGGKPLNGLSRENLEIVISFNQKHQQY